jgi:hypothetical protein
MPENADPLYYGLNKNKMLRPREIAYKIEGTVLDNQYENGAYINIFGSL